MTKPSASALLAFSALVSWFGKPLVAQVPVDAERAVEPARTQRPQLVVSPEVLPDRRVIVRLYAPQAHDVRTVSKATVEMLNKHGFTATFQESSGAHTWVNWRNYLYEVASQLFR